MSFLHRLISCQVLHFLFHAGSRAPHCASHNLPRWVLVLVLWKSVAVGQFSCFTPQLKAVCVSHSIIWVTVYFLRFSHFHNGFLRSHGNSDQQNDPSLCWTVLRGFSGPFNSPPDRTPLTLDKHNTKEKCKLLHAGKRTLLIPLGV